MKLKRVFVVLAMALFLLAPFSSVWSGWVKSLTPTIPTGQGLNGVNDLYFVNPDTGVGVGFRGGVYKTTDGGFLWRQLPLPLGRQVDLYSVCFLNSQEGWAGADGIVHTIDGAMNWEIEDVGESDPYNLFAAAIVGDEVWFLGWYDELKYPNTHGILMRRPIRGGAWSVRKFPEFGGFFGIKVITPDNVWLYGTNTVVQTTDYGQTFIDRSEGVRDSWVNFKQIAFDKQYPQLGYLTGNLVGVAGGKFFITLDGGQSWSLQKEWGDEMQALGLAIDGQTIYVSGGAINVNPDVGIILASTDSGKSWREVVRDTSARNTTFHSRIFQIGERMWVAWRTFWYYVPNQQPLFAHNLGTVSVAEQWQYRFRATDPDGDPLLFSLLQAPTFLHIDHDSGDVWFNAVEAIAGEYRVTVQVSDLNGGTDTMTFVLQVGLQPTAVADEEILGVPAKFALEQNYPNPFNSATTIGYTLPTSTDVRLSIYDLAGQELIVLVSERQPSGLYSVKFTAANLPSGPYIVRLTAGGAAQTRKMLLLK